MRPIPKLLVLALFCQFVTSQEIPDFSDLKSHEYYIGQLENSKDQNFQRILGLYDTYIRNNPSQVTAMVERCRFIGNSYYDAYEDYNLKYDETLECIEQLYAKYPTHPQVLIYRAENLYGDEELESLQESLRAISGGEWSWRDEEKSKIYQMLGEHFRYTNESEALRYYVRAQDFDPAQDLSIPLTELHQAMGNDELAKNTILSHLGGDTATWRMNNKAKLLLELGETERALELFDQVRLKDSTYIDNAEMAKAMINMGKKDLAREFLVKDTTLSWNKVGRMQALYTHDLEHADTKTALASYRSLQEANSYDDFLAVKRLGLFLKNPFLPWNFSELLHLFFLVLVIALLFVLPYIWILPIYNLGLWLKRRGKVIVPKVNFNWNLKHFWIMSFVYLLAQFLLILVFYYEENINAFFEVTFSYEEITEDEPTLAKSMLAFVAVMALGTLVVIKKNVLAHLYKSKIDLWESIKLGVAFVIFNIIFLKVLRSFITVETPDIEGLMFNAAPEIIAMLRTYGFGISFLAVALFGPIYEEIIFRGVVLGSVEKQLGFVTANIIQAAMFATIHYNFKLFLYYFVFGLITGYYAKRTGGLITGIVLHVINNFFVLLLLSILVR
nr:CPBP family intramembrane glutamic endopeptidase [Allomuricauda sp.]